MSAPGSSEIVLVTMNARYTHASFGLRCLLANLGEYRARATLLERTINERATDIVEAILERSPRLVGFGVYVWNAELTLEVVRALKQLAPQLVVVLGGPEVSHETEEQELARLADHVVTGEGELAFYDLVKRLFGGGAASAKIIDGGKPDLTALQSPYSLYSDDDLKHRIVYLEASRGCPYTCEFCLSALDDGVRAFPLQPFLAQVQGLLDRGLTSFKFVDRTFNLKLDVSLAILNFFRERLRPGLFLHFEMIPDRLPLPLRDALASFPPGTVQLELGVQTLNPLVGATIRRRQDVAKLEDNFRFLRQSTGVHLHADLIVGLPGETLASFGQGFDRLLALGPHEVQVGVLKRLRGAPIARHTSTHQMVYALTAPYEVLRTGALSFTDVQRLKRFARYFDLVHNNGRFPSLARLLLSSRPSAFDAFLEFSDWLWATTHETQGIAAPRLGRLVAEFLKTVHSVDGSRALADDLDRKSISAASHGERQARHHPDVPTGNAA